MDVGLACRRHLLRRRDYLEPLDMSARDHPDVAALIDTLVRILGHSMAGLQLRCGPALRLPQTGEPLLGWLVRRPGRSSLHSEPVSLRQRRRLTWRLYSQMVPECLCSLLDAAEAELAANLLTQDPDHSSEPSDLNLRLL